MSLLIGLGCLGAEAAAAAPPVTVDVVDGSGAVLDPATASVSIERTPPAPLALDPFAPSDDPDAVRFVLSGDFKDIPSTVTIHSFASSGRRIDSLEGAPLRSSPCARAPMGATCASTEPIRAAMDAIDRTHPLVAGRSIRAELGGAIAVLSPAGSTLVTLRVTGPRRTSLGPIERFRASLSVRLVRARAGGQPPMGDGDRAAIQIARAEIERANALWGQCGISFGPPAQADVRVVDPPPPHLLALGCGQALPASGGELRVLADGRPIAVTLAAGTQPLEAARLVVAALARAGLRGVVSANARVASAPLISADVLLRRANGSLGTFRAVSNVPISSDRTLRACIGEVDLSDGLQHFVDFNASAGTLEERTLIKALERDDPASIQVVMIPYFATGGRIGESFIGADGGALRNIVLEDRLGVIAQGRSFVLAHEVGHVLLDDPGHSDDLGPDTPTRLMDADASDGSAFGPRRLSTEECSRAIRQSGPGAASPLLRAWPLGT